MLAQVMLHCGALAQGFRRISEISENTEFWCLVRFRQKSGCAGLV